MSHNTETAVVFGAVAISIGLGALTASMPPGWPRTALWIVLCLAAAGGVVGACYDEPRKRR